MSAVLLLSVVPFARGTFPISSSDILLHSKSTMAQDSLKKSMPRRPSASVGREHTKIWWLNLRPPNTKETARRPLKSRDSPVTPYGRISVSLTSLLDWPGCNMEMLESVSMIKTLTSLSIRNEIEGVPCSNATETASLTTEFTVASRREELSSFPPFCHFPNYLIHS